MSSFSLPPSSSDSSLSISKSTQQLAHHSEAESHFLALLTLKTNEANALRATCEALKQQVADLQHASTDGEGKSKVSEEAEGEIVSQQFTPGSPIPVTHAPQDDPVLQELRQQNFDLQQQVASLQFVNGQNARLQKERDDLSRDLEFQMSTQTVAGKTGKDAQGHQDDSDNGQMVVSQNNIVAALVDEKNDMQAQLSASEKKGEELQAEVKSLSDDLEWAEEQFHKMSLMIKFATKELGKEQIEAINSYVKNGGVLEDYESHSQARINQMARKLELAALELTFEQSNSINSYMTTDGLTKDYKPYGRGPSGPS